MIVNSALVFAMQKSRFSYDAAHFIFSEKVSLFPQSSRIHDGIRMSVLLKHF